MNRERLLVGGGYLVRIHGGSGFAVEGVAEAHRGMVVQSAFSYLDGQHHRRGRYRLTQRAVKDTDLWRVVRLTPAVDNSGE